MSQYLLSIYQPDGPVPDADFLEPIMRDLESLNQEMKAAGAWVFAAGLHPADTATVLRKQGDEVLITDGPFTEGKEHLGGFTIIDVDDLDAALDWGRRLAKIVTLPVEVRPVQH
ncbi:YciI family protein [Arthrobacter sp. NPDC093128]|uniref:YciI family protein n=1 Tax=Arthrobacter sp. NPDC093128 TaxID=3154979 RepID=UPI003446E6EC